MKNPPALSRTFEAKILDDVGISEARGSSIKFLKNTWKPMESSLHRIAI